MPSRKRLFSIVSSSLAILITAVIAFAIGSENNYSLNLPSELSSDTQSIDFIIEGKEVDYYQLAFGPEQATPNYQWVESLKARNFTVKNMPATSDTYIRIFGYKGGSILEEDFKISSDGSEYQIENFNYSKGGVELGIVEPEPANEIESFGFKPTNGSEMIMNTFTVHFPETNVAYVAVGTNGPASDNIFYDEGKTMDHVTFSSKDLKPGDVIDVKVADQNYVEYYAQYKIVENGVVDNPDPQPEPEPNPEPQPEPSDGFTFTPATNSELSISNFVTIRFPETNIAYGGVGTNGPGSADIYYFENIITDHLTFSTKSSNEGDVIDVKIASTDGSEYYAKYTMSGGSPSPSPNPDPTPDPDPNPNPDDSFSFSPENGSTIPQGNDVTITFPEINAAYYAVGEGGKSGYEENVTISEITFNTSLYQTNDTIEVKIASADGPEHYATYIVGEFVDPYPDYDAGYKLTFVDGQRRINDCPIFTPDSYWNQPIDQMPVDDLSDKIINRMNIYNEGLRADFGDLWLGHPAGIPFNVVPANQPDVKLVDIFYPDSSDIPVCTGEPKIADAGCYPIPANVPKYPLLENVHPDTPVADITPENFSGDLHVLALQEDSCKLYEFFRFFPVLDDNGQSTGEFTAGGPTIWDLNKNADKFVGQKDDNMTCNRTSADAAGLPIFPGLVLYDEVKSGEINHALRFTVLKTRRAFVYPATHYASWISKDTYPADGSVEGISFEEFPPMGARFRLKADFDISGYHPDVQVILKAIKKYGMIMADNGGPNFISGAPDKRWNNDIINQLKTVPTTALELVEMGKIYDPETVNALGIEMDTYNCAGMESNHVDEETFRLPDYAQ